MFYIFYKFVFFVSDFLAIQRLSFNEFLHSKLEHKFLQIQPLTNTRKWTTRKFEKTHKISLNFVYNNYKFVKPKFNIKESIVFKKTYCSHFYFPVQFLDHQTGFRHLQWVWLGTLPLLTRRGHFIINGTPRIVLNQIVRCPGIYFQKEIRQNARWVYAEIISNRGPWVRVEMDSKQKVWISLQQKGIPRMELFDFFKVNHLPTKYKDQNLFLNNSHWCKFNLANTKSPVRCCVSPQMQFEHYLVKQFRLDPKKRADCSKTFSISAPLTLPTVTLESLNALRTSASKSIEQNITAKLANVNVNKAAKILFASSTREIDLNFDLGQTGRQSLNAKLGLALTTRTLTPIDLIKIREVLCQLTNNSNTSLLDDIDDLQNRQLNTIGELLTNQLERGLQRLKKSVERNFQQLRRRSWYFTPSRGNVLKSVAHKRTRPLNKQIQKARILLWKANALINNQSLNSTFKEFFHSHQLSQYLDQSNPLAEITHKRRLSCLGSGGVNRETAGMEIRGIHSTHYGRICPIETPEGKNAGLVNSLTTAVHINGSGDLLTPFVHVYKQHIQNQKKLVFVSTSHQQKQNIFFNNKLPKFKNCSVGILKTNSFQKYSVGMINFVAFTPQQFLSIATTCIPFIEHNDANRALMGSNMQRQSLPLISLEQPLVTTFNACRVLSDLKDIPTSGHSSVVVYTSKVKMSILNWKPNLVKKLTKQKIHFQRVKTLV